MKRNILIGLLLITSVGIIVFYEIRISVINNHYENKMALIEETFALNISSFADKLANAQVLSNNATYLHQGIPIVIKSKYGHPICNLGCIQAKTDLNVGVKLSVEDVFVENYNNYLKAHSKSEKKNE